MMHSNNEWCTIIPELANHVLVLTETITMLTTATHNELLQTNNFTLEIHKHNQTFHLPQNQEIFYFLNRKLVLIFEYGLQQESYCLEGMGFLNFYFSTYKWDNSSFRNSFRGFPV